MSKMNQEVKAKWVAALRSGKYKQGRYKLTTMRGGLLHHCCLGVLCELYSAEHPEFPREEWLLRCYIPFEVQGWAGVQDNPFVPAVRDSLGNLNDGGHDFNKIADIIEEHL